MVKGVLLFLFVITISFSYGQINNQKVLLADSAKHQYYFYKGYDYGGQAIYNPVYVLVNRGFDITQIQYEHRDFLDFDYKLNAENVLKSIRHPIKNIEELGWNKFLRTEIFPATFSLEGRWVPNYFLHLLGGGVTYRSCEEWFRMHDYKYPKLFSATIMMASAFINETMENNNATTRKNTDAIADFFIFDLGAVLLFNNESLCKFMSDKVKWADWSFQPSFTFPNFYLHNHGQHYAIKTKIPFVNNLRLFNLIGLETFTGASYKFKNNTSLSMGVGFAASRMVTYEKNPNQNTITTKRGMGFFYDKNNSVLASVILCDVVDYFCQVNVYPGLIKIGKFSPGLWSVFSRDGQAVFGISTSYTFGFGVGYDFITEL